LAGALLVLIIYGATWQVAHAHDTSTPRFSAACSVSNSDTSDSSDRHTGDNDGCLICQFQRQLFSNLVSKVPQVILPLQAELSRFGTPTSFPLSTQNAPTRGRAPPSTFLVQPLFAFDARP